MLVEDQSDCSGPSQMPYMSLPYYDTTHSRTAPTYLAAWMSGPLAYLSFFRRLRLLIGRRCSFRACLAGSRFPTDLRYLHGAATHPSSNAKYIHCICTI